MFIMLVVEKTCFVTGKWVSSVLYNIVAIQKCIQWTRILNPHVALHAQSLAQCVVCDWSVSACCFYNKLRSTCVLVVLKHYTFIFVRSRTRRSESRGRKSRSRSFITNSKERAKKQRSRSRSNPRSVKNQDDIRNNGNADVGRDQNGEKENT